jgi:hypothetical protein
MFYGVLNEERMVYCHSCIMFNKPFPVVEITAIVLDEERFDMNNFESMK